MATLVELDGTKHQNLKVAPTCAMDLAKEQHVVNIRVSEVAKALSNFPVFLTKSSNTNEWSLSAITGLELGKNLFVEDGVWKATYVPTCIQTYPFYLMKSPRDEKQATVGIDETSNVFSEEDGEPLFDENNKASLYLSRVTALLQADMKNDIQTFQFVKHLEELNLLQEIDALVHYEDSRVNTLTGLNTIHEDNMQALNAEQLEDLHQKGYLAPIYALLMSIYQFNALILRQNALEGADKVMQVKVEVEKDKTAT